MKADLDKLVELQKTDTNLRRLKQIIETAVAKRAEIEHEFEQHAFSIREIQARRDKLHADRAGLEKQIAENKTYLERADRNLKHAQNQKEYETAMRETDALQKQIATFEAQVIEAVEAAESVEKELAERAEEINSLDAKRDAALADVADETGFRLRSTGTTQPRRYCSSRGSKWFLQCLLYVIAAADAGQRQKG